MKLVDLSLSVVPGSVSEPDFGPQFGSPPEIEYFAHREGAEAYKYLFGCTNDDLPDGLGNGIDKIMSITHSSTHLDAPWHFAPFTDNDRGKAAKTIDQIPLEWCYGDGVVVDVRDVPIKQPITAAHCQEALAKINYKIKPRDIVFFQTGADKLWGKPEYQSDFPGMSKEAAIWFIDQGVKVMGVDAYNFDLPFPTQIEIFKRTGDRSVIEPCHYLGREREYLHIEKLANLDELPRPFGFKVSCFPIKFEKASASWVRVVAYVED
ncbi:MAG: cyclase family protein [Chloroflexi bacterium]|nr:cyclase family protein [Chloroflexota bacterium]